MHSILIDTRVSAQRRQLSCITIWSGRVSTASCTIIKHNNNNYRTNNIITTLVQCAQQNERQNIKRAKNASDTQHKATSAPSLGSLVVDEDRRRPVGIFLWSNFIWTINKGKGKGFPYSTPSVGPGADPGVQAVSLQVTVSHPPGGRLPLLSARPAVTSPATEHHRPLAGTKLYCLVTEAHRCKQLA